MRLLRPFRAAPALGLLSLALGVACAAGHAVAALGPTADVVERFGADPLADERWFASGSWAWEPRGTTLSSSGRGGGVLIWRAGSHYTGTLRLRFRLGTAQARARLLFAYDPASGAHRWVEAAAGAPGRILLGQTGEIRGSSPGIMQAWRAPVPAGAWHDLDLRVAADKGVTVSLDGARLFTAAAAPLAPGLVGLATASGPVGFAEFGFTADPDGEPCWECHAGQPAQALAADVYRFWDGRWWDATQGGVPQAQQGGHGDPGGKPALGCTGPAGCHRMREPAPEEHRNGLREGRGRPSLNAYHLRPEFIVERPERPWDAQLAFDAYCTAACHAGAGVASHSHELDSMRDPPEGIPGVVQFGDHLSRPDGEALPVPVDSDITRRATTTTPDFAPCVSCHDPHGSGSIQVRGEISNLMLRANYTGDLCRTCHL